MGSVLPHASTGPPHQRPEPRSGLCQLWLRRLAHGNILRADDWGRTLHHTRGDATRPDCSQRLLRGEWHHPHVHDHTGGLPVCHKHREPLATGADDGRREAAFPRAAHDIQPHQRLWSVGNDLLRHQLLGKGAEEEYSHWKSCPEQQALYRGQGRLPLACGCLRRAVGGRPASDAWLSEPSREDGRGVCQQPVYRRTQVQPHL